MGWASEALERDLAKAGIYPVNINSCSGCSYSSNSSNSQTVKKKNYRRYYEYDFPTEAQVRALNFITTYTGVVFEGTTKGEARIFIAEYMDYAKEEKENE